MNIYTTEWNVTPPKGTARNMQRQGKQEAGKVATTTGRGEMCEFISPSGCLGGRLQPQVGTQEARQGRSCGGGGNRWGRPQPPAHRETAGEQCSLWRSPSRTSWGGNGDSRLAPSLPSGWLCYHHPHSHWLEAVLMEGCSRCGCVSLQDVCHRLLPLATVCHHLATVCHHLSPSATTGHHQPPSATT